MHNQNKISREELRSWGWAKRLVANLIFLKDMLNETQFYLFKQNQTLEY